METRELQQPVTLHKLIRNCKSGMFFCDDGTWTAEPSAAKHFEDVESLLSTAAQIDLTDLEEFLMMGDSPSQYDVALPLRISRRDQKA